MPSLQGRRRRPNHAPSVLVQARIDPEVRAKAHRSAEALGVSFSAYVELLMQYEQVDELGRPLWWTGNFAEDEHREEQPLSRPA